MIKKEAVTICLLSILINSLNCQYVSPNNFAVESPRLALLGRVSFRQQKELESKDKENKSELFH